MTPNKLMAKEKKQTNLAQKVFPLPKDNTYTLEDFIISESNQMAYNAIIQWPNSIWGTKPYDKMLHLIGPKSSGKTHLARIWQKRAGELLDSSKFNIFENIEKENEQDLFHAFNASNEMGLYVLLTSNGHCNFRLPDLKSRINSLNVIQIGLPCDDLISAFIFKQFSNYSVKISAEVIQYLLNILPRDLSTIEQKINYIQSTSLASKRRITIPFIKQIIEEL